MLNSSCSENSFQQGYSTPFWQLEQNLAIDLGFKLLVYSKNKNRDWYQLIGPRFIAILLIESFPGIACYLADYAAEDEVNFDFNYENILCKSTINEAKNIFTTYLNVFFELDSKEWEHLSKNFRHFLVQLSFDIIDSNNAKLFDFLLQRSPEFFEAFSLFDLQNLIASRKYSVSPTVEAAIVESIYRRFSFLIKELFCLQDETTDPRNNLDLKTLHLLAKYQKLTEKDQNKLLTRINKNFPNNQGLSCELLTLLSELESKQKTSSCPVFYK